MARACPACGRPNRDDASRCLYCVAPLPPDAAPDAAVVDPAGSDRRLVILLPGDDADEGRVAELSRITGLSLYDARLSLSSRRPRLFRRLESEAGARRLSEELSRARIPHYVVSEGSVLSLPVATASSLEVREHHLEVQLPAAPPVSLPKDEVLLLVRGEITRERHHERRILSNKGASRRLTPGLRLHIYTSEAEIAIEIDPESFDFRVLGSERTPSTLLNSEKLVLRLSAAIPALEVDRGFDQEPAVLSRAGGSPDVSDALAESERGPEGVLHDNEAQFRFYARWRYRVARHLSRRGIA